VNNEADRSSEAVVAGAAAKAVAGAGEEVKALSSAAVNSLSQETLDAAA